MTNVNDIFAKQDLLQRVINDNNLGYGRLHELESVGEVVEFIKNSLMSLQIEVIELVQEIGNDDRAILKPWSSKHAAIIEQKFTSNDKIKSEAIDVLCFCMNLVMAAGITPENIDEEFNKVWQRNIQRQQQGY